jgi:hypothetical protein
MPQFTIKKTTASSMTIWTGTQYIQVNRVRGMYKYQVYRGNITSSNELVDIEPSIEHPTAEELKNFDRNVFVLKLHNINWSSYISLVNGRSISDLASKAITSTIDIPRNVTKTVWNKFCAALFEYNELLFPHRIAWMQKFPSLVNNYEFKAGMYDSVLKNCQKYSVQFQPGEEEAPFKFLTRLQFQPVPSHLISDYEYVNWVNRSSIVNFVRKLNAMVELTTESEYAKKEFEAVNMIKRKMGSSIWVKAAEINKAFQNTTSIRDARRFLCQHPEQKNTLALMTFKQQEEDMVTLLLDRLRRHPEIPKETISYSNSNLDKIQNHAISEALRCAMYIIHGGAGVGKTNTIAGLIQLSQALGYYVIAGAPTGAASNNIDHYARGKISSTQHRLILPRVVYNHQTYCTRHRSTSILILDEQSMTGLDMMRKLLRSYSFVDHMVLVGDDYQLPPFGSCCGEPFSDMIKSGVVPATQLQHVYRSNGTTIIANANKLRAPDTWINFTYDNSFSFCVDEFETNGQLVTQYPTSATCGSVFDHKNLPMVITFLNRDVDDLNIRLQKKWLDLPTYLHNREEGRDYLDLTKDYYNCCPDRKDRKVSPHVTYFCVGDPVVHKRNEYDGDLKDRRLLLNNGASGCITHVGYGNEVDDGLGSKVCRKSQCKEQNRHLSARFNDCSWDYSDCEKNDNLIGCYRNVDQNGDSKLLVHGYARTIHAAQGLESEVVYIHLGRSPYCFTRRTLYTAITRAKRRVVIFGKTIKQLNNILPRRGRDNISRVATLLRTGIQQNSSNKRQRLQ